ncbi:CYFA0S15e01816g1_1 [Cyberlindnera fabianii]|uniref:Succinate dehydrogenase assembly factor 4, mitochondrial n=1 Tax=Cyberlindnera fabianii TaxID=36022 RepID=A0A061BA01_CYBFA|nr:Succinate dehydrogenase assembly factor 4, mitochondrial [Cyberlindnera fabianii]CDR44710.1 CYFA0S15e01816g1_1 [Cyberlindnera fabianii]
MLTVLRAAKKSYAIAFQPVSQLRASAFATSVRFYSFKKDDFAFTPGPPKLPKEDQEEFEALQKMANSQAAIDEYNASLTDEVDPAAAPYLGKAGIDIGSFSPEFFKTIPEFEGDVNPKTGEIGGPKQDPLRHGDYSFNGRVTDF